MSPRRAKPPLIQTAVPAKAVKVARWGGTVALVAAAAMSVQTLYRLGRILGYAWWNAPLLPASLDVYAATAIWVGHRVPAEHPARDTARVNARVALGLTVGANGLFHLLNLPGVDLPRWITVTLLVLVSALPPLVVERILHLQMTVSAGRVETASDNQARVTANDNPARPVTPTANRAETPTPAANDNPAPADNRQTVSAPIAKAAANDSVPADSGSTGVTEALVAATLPVYRQILADTKKRPTAPALVEAVEGLNTASRAKQIREIIERRFPDLAPRLRAVEAVEQVS